MYACRIMGYLPRRALALGIPNGMASMRVGGALPCVSGSFAATASSPSLSIGGGTSSVAYVGAAKENCVTAFSSMLVPA